MVTASSEGDGGRSCPTGKTRLFGDFDTMQQIPIADLVPAVVDDLRLDDTGSAPAPSVVDPR